MTGHINTGFIARLLVDRVVIQPQGAISAAEELALITFKSVSYLDAQDTPQPLTAPIVVGSPVQIPFPFQLLAACRIASETGVVGPEINEALSQFNPMFWGVLAGLELSVNQIEFIDL